MKQKYAIIRKDDANGIVIREFSELDKGILSLVCEETYDLDRIREAAAKGKEILIPALRTNNMYPPGAYVSEIADNVISLLQSDEKTAAELFFDELTFLVKEKKEAEEAEEEEESSDIDELLDDDDIEDTFDDDDTTISNINSPIKIADDDTLEIDDDI